MKGELRFDSEEGSFYLDKLTVIEISGSDLPENVSSKLNQVVEKLVGKYLTENPIYTLDDENTSEKLAKALIKSFTVKKDAIAITLAP